MERKRFLTHVNALRGLAILLVFLYHLCGAWCPYGFLGVDAFFVISGFFLIPPILALRDQQLQSGLPTGFHWWKYYRGKLVRIIPPLAAMVLLVLLAAIPFLIPEDLKDASRAAQSVMTGAANVHLGKQAVDYFAASVKENLFLHTWYIAVLLQVLLVAPLLCVPLSRLRAGWRYGILLLLMLLSAAIFFQHWLPRDWQQALPSAIRDGGSLGSVYYQTAGRLWQVLAGGMIAFLPAVSGRALRTLLLTLGILLLIIPSFFWGQYYSGFALLAVLGAMLAIRYGEHTAASPLLENRALMWLGTVSFSLYLIHWPLFALGRYILIRDFTLWECAGMTVLSLLLAWVLYQLLEKRRRSLTTTIILWGLTFACLLTIRRTDGLAGYIFSQEVINPQPSYTANRVTADSYWKGDFPDFLVPPGSYQCQLIEQAANYKPGKKPLLHIGNDNIKPNFVLLGDSYAHALHPGLDLIGQREGWSGIMPCVYVTPFWNRLNTEFNIPFYLFTRVKAEALMNWLAQNPHLHYVIIDQRWFLRFYPAETWDGQRIPPQQAALFSEHALREFCARLKQMGREVILILPMPELSLSNAQLIERLIQRMNMWYADKANAAGLSCTQAQYEATLGAEREFILKLSAEGYCRTLDPAAFLFENGVYNPLRGTNTIVRDYGHLTVYGATLLADCWKDQLNSILNSTDTINTAAPPSAEETQTAAPGISPSATAQ